MLFDKFFKASKKVLPFEKARPQVTGHQDINGLVEENLERLIKYTGNPLDLVIHRFTTGGKNIAAVAYLKSLVDENLLGIHVVEPMNKFVQNNKEIINVNNVRLLLSTANVSEFHDLHKAVESLMTGQALIFLPHSNKALAVYLPGFPRRQIKEPATEKVSRGSREGFTDVLTDNLSMIRRWIRDPNLRVNSKIIGERTKTEVAITYLHDVANPDIVQEVYKRLDQIHIDGILDSGYLSELITDKRLTYFPLVQETERPDKVAAAILEGRVAILVDKSPFALIVPVTATEFYQNISDFNYNYFVGSFLRLIRGIGTLTSVTLPGFYVSVISINPELLPAFLVQLISSTRVNVPFPAFFEVLFVMIVYEIFREASIRVPSSINLVLGIAGGIVLGQAVIQSGLASGVTIAIVVFTALASYSTANAAKEQAWRLTRYFLFFAGASFGILGLTLAGMVVLAHMSSLKSFGVSYLGPWSPPLMVDMVDSYIRLPWWASYRRPPTYRPQQEDRLGKTEGEDEA